LTHSLWGPLQERISRGISGFINPDVSPHERFQRWPLLQPGPFKIPLTFFPKSIGFGPPFPVLEALLNPSTYPKAIATLFSKNLGLLKFKPFIHPGNNPPLGSSWSPKNAGWELPQVLCLEIHQSGRFSNHRL